MSSQKKFKKATILLASGGTGGHFFPAVSLAEQINKNGHNAIIIADARVERYFRSTNITCTKTCVKSIQGSKIKKFCSLIFLFFAFIQALFLIVKYRPNSIIGFGGYASFPTMLAGIVTFRKLYIHEQNAVLGKVNRVLSRYADKIFLSFEETLKLDKSYKDKSIFVGNLLRKDLIDKAINQKQKTFEKITILITGGSQASKIFAEIIPKVISKLDKDIVNNIRIFHQAKDSQIKQLKKFYDDLGISNEVKQFFTDIDDKTLQSDIAICRSGSSSLFENALYGASFITIPLPNSADNHQYYNAKYFADNHAAILVEEGDNLIDNLYIEVLNLINHENYRKNLSQNAKKLFKVNAVEKLLNEL